MTNFDATQYGPSSLDPQTGGGGTTITHERGPLVVFARDVKTVAADPNDPLGTVVTELAGTANHHVLQTGGARWFAPYIISPAALTTAPIFAAFGLLRSSNKLPTHLKPDDIGTVPTPSSTVYNRWAIPLADTGDSYTIDGFSTTPQVHSDTTDNVYRLTGSPQFVFCGGVPEIILLTTTAAASTGVAVGAGTFIH